jgi:DNA repair protein RAD50
MQELSEKLREGLEKLDSSDYKSLLKKKEEITKKLQNLTSELGGIDGRMRSIMDGRNVIEKELQDGKYRTVDEDYKAAVIDCVLQETICEDLNKYYTALDQAVIKYHQTKLEQINRLIRHYWRQTYQGSDIEGIAIMDESAESTADKRRVYNYRVVMIKNGKQMDMRGRCSAGQKVLASIVIRIALSQIFCVKCPILTLDEPTTNLDSKNIGALASAISTIAQEQRGKMQLIIITHDEEFLKHLNEENSEYYYKVEKREGLSIIIRKNISDRE